MARYIDANALYEKIYPLDLADKRRYAINAQVVADAINNAPTADVVPMGEVQEIFKEFDRMFERYGYEPYYTVQDMEIEVNILKEKYAKGGEGK